MQFESVFWIDGRKCPYCGSNRSTPYSDGKRYQCTSCFTAFSATVGTFAQGTHLPFEVWSCAINIVSEDPSISLRKLAKRLQVSVKTAARLKKTLLTQNVADRLQISNFILVGKEAVDGNC